jgi:hypothetical protein
LEGRGEEEKKVGNKISSASIDSWPRFGNDNQLR